MSGKDTVSPLIILFDGLALKILIPLDSEAKKYFCEFHTPTFFHQEHKIYLQLTAFKPEIET